MLLTWWMLQKRMATPEGKLIWHQAQMRLPLIGSLAAIMLRMTSTQQAGGAAAILGAGANWAARSGIDWAINRSVALGGCPAATTPLALTEGTLSGFRVVVGCASTSHFEGLSERTSLSIQSEATFGVLGTRDFVFRELQASAVLSEPRSRRSIASEHVRIMTRLRPTAPDCARLRPTAPDCVGGCTTLAGKGGSRTPCTKNPPTVW